MVAADFPNVSIIQNGKNLGFGAPPTRGLPHPGPYVLSLNPDTVLHPGAIGWHDAIPRSASGRGGGEPEDLRADGSLDWRRDAPSRRPRWRCSGSAA